MTRILLTILGLLAGRIACEMIASEQTFPSCASTDDTKVDVSAVCLQIAISVSPASGVFFNGTEPYPKDISHFSASSSQESACSFEPGMAEDVGTALQILGKTRTAFAVKGGGHTLNPNFSSTPGVQIAMYRFTNVTYDSVAQTATIGAGMIWDDVYSALEPYGVNVVGARVSGVGVAGLTLGGGYSWHTNQYGLTVDTVEAFQLVLPNGTVTDVTASEEDLFFALKGGFNNFKNKGIVTQFTLRAFSQTQVWGGTIIYNTSDIGQLTRATANFSTNNTDPKAAVITAYGYSKDGDASEVVTTALLFYDAPTPPEGLFDGFLTNYSETQVFTRSFVSLVQSSGANASYGLRGAFDTLSVLEYPVEFLQAMVNESLSWGTTLPVGTGYVSYSAEPFLPTIYRHNTTPSAYPGSRALAFLPTSVNYAWNTDEDNVMIKAIKVSTGRLRENAERTKAVGEAETNLLPLYGNYALWDTPLEMIYGVHLERLRKVKKEVDPKDVMGLAGGFKFS
ncbi:hypothetical protein F5I97DRAFT_1229441 [Phlebopus sp. FC_14]|nr:hypothetical protein F5I97DRAFT_1229441 [Phlebopus sp. FC_14]